MSVQQFKLGEKFIGHTFTLYGEGGPFDILVQATTARGAAYCKVMSGNRRGEVITLSTWVFDEIERAKEWLTPQCLS